MKIIKEQTIENKNMKVESFLFIDGIVVGILAGIVGVIYRLLIEYSSEIAMFFSEKITQSILYVILLVVLLTVMGLVSVFTITKEPFVGGSGIPQVAAEVTGRIRTNPFKVIGLKLIGGTVSSAGGLSLGREGPSIQLGAMCGKIIAKLFKRTKIRENYLMTSGASAGLSVAFHAPLAGVIFSIEEIHKNLSKKLIISCFSAALVADIISQLAFGFKPVFSFPEIGTVAISTYGYIAVLGVFLGVCGTLYNRTMRGMFSLYKKMGAPIKIRPFIAFGISGIVFFIYPQVLGSGHNLVEMIIYSKYTMYSLAALFVLKMLFSLISFTSGVAGGIFLPILVQGAILGALFCQIIKGDNIGLFVIISMAGYLTAVVRNPLTSVVLIFEMTRSLNGFLPLAVCCLLSYFTANILGTKPVYEFLLDRVLSREEDMDEESVEVEIIVVAEAGASIIGKKIKELNWLEGGIIVQIERSGRFMLPKGNTEIKQNDKLTLHLQPANADKIIRKIEKI